MNKFIILGLIVVIILAGFLLYKGGSEQVPPETTETADSVTDVAEPVVPAKNIIDIAVETPQISSLVTAITVAQLVDVLSGEGPFTVFAPVNEAFAVLPAGTLDTLLAPENITDLQSVLTYHVVPGTYTTTDLTDGLTLTTVQGATITIGVTSNGISLNGGTNLITPDIAARNGVIHLIDAVILPPQE